MSEKVFVCFSGWVCMWLYVYNHLLCLFLTDSEEKVLLENTKQETEKLQKKVSDLQNELKQELRKAKQAVDGQVSCSSNYRFSICFEKLSCSL